MNTVRDIAKYDPAMDSTSIVDHLVYDAFGQVTSETNPAVDSLFLFTARPFDSDTQLQNNLNRWCDPAVGKWLSEDPIGYRAEDTNLYRYVRNGATVLDDSLGLKDDDSSDSSKRFLEAIEAASTVKDLLKEVADPHKGGSLTFLLDVPSQLVQDQLFKFLRALNEFRAESKCGLWYKGAVEAILAAHRGDGRMCYQIDALFAADRHTLGDNCANSLMDSSRSTLPTDAFCKFARQIASRCAELARRNMKNMR